MLTWIGSVKMIEKFPDCGENAGVSGGNDSLFKYTEENFIYPEGMYGTEVKDRSIVIFIIEEDGSVTDAVIGQGTGGELDIEALRVINNMPSWQPGEHRGRKVAVKMVIPVPLSLSESYQQRNSSLDNNQNSMVLVNSVEVTYNIVNCLDPGKIKKVTILNRAAAKI